jgi:cytochrome c oxidase assembly protein subunit 15
MEFRFRQLAVGTAALTGILLLLGVYTAAVGAGLTCGQRWPLCDGFLGLFPANWPSFVEWFHRLVAMVTGVVVLGTTVAAWRCGRSRRVRYALAGALLVLPSQIVLGALTVTRYEWAILLAHFATATVIFSLLVLAAAWSFDDGPGPTATGARRAAAVAAGLLPVAALLSPRLLLAYTAPVQVAYYAVLLASFAALLGATVWLRGRRPRVLTAVGAALVGLLLVVGRLSYGETGVYATVVALTAAFCGTAVAVQRSMSRAGGGQSPARSTDSE